MTSTIYLDTASKVARAALTGTAPPAVSAKLLSHLKLIIIYFEGADITTVDADTMRCVIKPKSAPAGAPALIDTSAVFTGTGETAQYVFEWDSADSVALRAHLDAAADPTQPQELRCEVEYELDGKPERVAFPIYFETSYTRPEDPAPEANADTSWEWLKLRAPEANGFTHDDDLKTLEVDADPAAAAHIDRTDNPHSVTKDQVGLGNVTNDAQLKASDLDTDATFAANSDAKIPSQKAVKTAVDLKINTAARGANDGVAPLDSSGKVPAANLPDDVIKVSTEGDLPLPGASNKLYVITQNKKIYHWDGASYVELVPFVGYATVQQAQTGTGSGKLMDSPLVATAIAALAPSKIRQVVVQSLSTPVTGSTLNAWADLMSGSITPQVSNSTIFLFVAGSVAITTNNFVATGAAGLGFRVVNGGNPLSQGDAAGSRGRASVSRFVRENQPTTPALGMQECIPFTLLETHQPGSVAAQTYTLQLYPVVFANATTLTWALNTNSTADTDAATTLRGVTKMILIEAAP